MTDTKSEFPLYSVVEQLYEEQTYEEFASAFASINDLYYQLDSMKQELINRMRDLDYSWTDIGRDMHVSRQAAISWAAARGMYTPNRRNPKIGGAR